MLNYLPRVNILHSILNITFMSYYGTVVLSLMMSGVNGYLWPFVLWPYVRGLLSVWPFVRIPIKKGATFIFAITFANVDRFQ